MSSSAEEKKKNLLELGVGEGSKVEHIKAESQYLQGQIQEELQQPTPRFTEPQVQLMKFHGVYQQEDRDQRQSRKNSGEEKAYQFMIRSRIPGGILSAEQYLIHDRLASLYGNETMRITTRQGIQLHGILKGELKPTISAINDALLSTLAACGDVNRNVMACPAPTADRAHAQVEQIAHQIAMRLTPHSAAYHDIWIDGEKVETIEQPTGIVEPLYGPTYLPRKFKIGVAFPGDNCIDVYTQDIGLVAKVENDTLIGFTVLIGGGMGSTHGKTETFPRLAEPLCFATVDQVLPVVETIVTIQRDYGDRTNRKHARMKYLVQDQGIAWFRKELESRLEYAVGDPEKISWQGNDDHLGWHQQGEDRWFLGLYVENGRVKDTESVRFREGLRTAIERFQPGIRLTGQQNILLTDISGEQRQPLEDLLSSYGIEVNAAKLGTKRLAMACPALPTCGLALAEAERTLPDLVTQIEAELVALDLGEEPVSIRMTGCPNGCARPCMGDIGIVGRSKDLYNVYVGGDAANTRLNTLYVPSVRADNIVAVLRPLFAFWKDKREQNEGLGDFCNRYGVSELQQTLTTGLQA